MGCDFARCVKESILIFVFLSDVALATNVNILLPNLTSINCCRRHRKLSSSQFFAFRFQGFCLGFRVSSCI